MIYYDLFLNWSMRNELWDCSHLTNRSPYQTSTHWHKSKCTNRIKPQSVKKNKIKQQQLSRKINRSK